MDSRVGFSIHLAAAGLRPPGRLQLQDGEILTVHVGQAASKNHYSVSIRGITLTIASARKLKAGTNLQARVAMVGDRIELKILQNSMPPVAPGTRDETLPTPPPGMSRAFALLIVQAMQRTGLPVTSQAMAAVGAMVPPSRRNDPGIVRFAAILFDKYLKLDPDRLDELYLTINGEGSGKPDGGSAGQDQGRGGDNSESHKNAESEISPHGTSSAERPTQTPEQQGSGERNLGGEAVSQRLAAQLRAQTLGRGPKEAGSVALLNHCPGAHEAWIIVPFNLGIDPTTLDGSVRFLVDMVALRSGSFGGQMPVRRAVVVVKGIGAFEIVGSPPKRVSLHVESIPTHSEFLRFLPELEEKLRNLGVEIDDTNNGGAVFDGFTAETREIRGVDASA